MRAPRIYYPKKLHSGLEVMLNSNASQHLLHVLRLRLGDNIILFDGSAGEYNASLIEVKAHLAIIKVENFIPKKVESPLKIYLAQSLVLVKKMDYIIQKAVELGVHEIIPLFSERCNVKIPAAKINRRTQRWQTIIINACEQSGRTYVPIVAKPQQFSVWIATPHIGQGLLLDPQSSQSLTALKSYQAVTIVIGPEGGLTTAEITLAKQHDFLPIKLGPRILRTETASLAAISALQIQSGDF